MAGSKPLPKHYEPKNVEPKWQKKWLKSRTYVFNRRAKNKITFAIDTPPPFTSGDLHIGRAYACILSDVTARYKRMRGYNVLLPQGWDTQGLPTELAVQRRLRVSPENVDEFRSACKKWTRQMIRRMRAGMQCLGYVPDWSFEYKTMDKECHRKVQLALLNLYHMGRIYRSKHPIHWCPKCQTALADAELGYKKEEAVLAFAKFKVENATVEVATTRPELLHACVAVAYHPQDKRYQHLADKKAQVPIYNTKVPIIADLSVDPQYGTGLVMICTFGDEQDVKTAIKHSLPTIEALQEDGRIINSGKYDGLSASEARKAILADLNGVGVLSKGIKISHDVLAHMERSTCQTSIELLSKPQWFIRITDLKEKMTQMAHQVEWSPKDIKKRLLDWIEGLEWDWLFSRQRTFGTPVPFWHCQECNHVIPPREEDLPVDPAKQKAPVKKCPSCENKAITGAKDVCDCWVDSSITPLVIAGWPEALQNYPLSLRQQGSEIIRTWGFYSIVQCLLQTGRLPFRTMLVNGMILGSDGHAMSSSLGNTVNPSEVVDKYGADALRQGLLMASVGSDFPFELKDVAYARSFMQKFWNACRFAQNHLTHYKPPKKTPRLCVADKGILSCLQNLVKTLTERMEAFQFNIALQALQSFVWHELCDYYIETVKNRLYAPKKKEMKKSAQYTLYVIMSTLTRLCAPFAPHMAEQISHTLFGKSAANGDWPETYKGSVDEEAEKAWTALKEAMSTLWKLKSQLQLPLNAEIPIAIIRYRNARLKRILEEIETDIKGAGKIGHVMLQKDEQCVSFEICFPKAD